jgi:hypothetical protein
MSRYDTNRIYAWKKFIEGVANLRSHFGWPLPTIDEVRSSYLVNRIVL